jgi:hypothetical protein
MQVELKCVICGSWFKVRLSRVEKNAKYCNHKDGNKHNNDPENIEIITQAEHIRRHHPYMIRKQREKRNGR